MKNKFDNPLEYVLEILIWVCGVRGGGLYLIECALYAVACHHGGASVGCTVPLGEDWRPIRRCAQERLDTVSFTLSNTRLIVCPFDQCGLQRVRRTSSGRDGLGCVYHMSTECSESRTGGETAVA